MRTRRRPLLLRGVSALDDEDDESPPLLPPLPLPPPLVLTRPLLELLPTLTVGDGVFGIGTRLGRFPPVTARGGVLEVEVDGIVF